MKVVNDTGRFHVLTVGWERSLIEQLWSPVASRSPDRFSHVLHPRHLRDEWPAGALPDAVYFLRDRSDCHMPGPDRKLLASLEQEEVPTVHNMILGDRVVSRLAHDDALTYGTLLARRMFELFEQTNPSVIIGGFDAIHAGIGLAVAKRMKIPWFALNFSVIPQGLACFCDRLSPAARVQLPSTRPADDLHKLAHESLEKFEAGSISAYAYIEPPLPTIAGKLARLPGRVRALVRTMRNAQQRDFLRFTDSPGGYSVPAAMESIRGATRARKAVSKITALATPPSVPYVLFGLHTQPESSIDVWAPFFSNQLWVIELLSRSIPASHKLLVKIHKSDTSSFSREQLERMRMLPGVELVRPFVDTRSFIECADLVVAIQGTMGLEAALLGKPVIMLGDSPVTIFRNASKIGELQDLPDLICNKLSEPQPTRRQIVQDYASYLAPFSPASHNDWTRKIGDQEIDGYVRLLDRLEQHLSAGSRDLDAAHERFPH
ncbi:MAG: DUF354 domain-containing protein [Woeseiaceae bacterium]